MDVFYNDLLKEISKIAVVDTHEHLEPESVRTSRNIDLFNVFMTHYASSDLVSAGMSQDNMKTLKESVTDLDKKWNIFKPYWEKAQNTSYCRALKIAMKDLYGIDRLHDDTYRLLNDKMVQANRQGLYRTILEQRSNIAFCIWDNLWGSDPDHDPFFKAVARLDSFVFIRNKMDIQHTEKMTNLSVESLDTLLKVVENFVHRKLHEGIIGFKCGLAYMRSLFFDNVDKGSADQIFNRILSGENVSESDAKALQDYMMHYALGIVSQLKMPYQFHTGLQEGNGNYIANANPRHLANVIMRYSGVKFDLFHGGYPYGGELSALAKNFPNAYVDMCWLHIISPEYSKRYLSEWLDTVPANKIFGFGGDYIFPEGSYGHITMARENITRVLAKKVEEGLFTEEYALNVAKYILHDNPLEIYTRS